MPGNTFCRSPAGGWRIDLPRCVSTQSLAPMVRFFQNRRTSRKATSCACRSKIVDPEWTMALWRHPHGYPLLHHQV